MSSHDETLCDSVEHSTVDQIKDKVRNAQWICKECGRAANKKEYLCEPIEL